MRRTSSVRADSRAGGATESADSLTPSHCRTGDRALRERGREWSQLEPRRRYRAGLGREAMLAVEAPRWSPTACPLLQAIEEALASTDPGTDSSLAFSTSCSRLRANSSSH